MFEIAKKRPKETRNVTVYHEFMAKLEYDHNFIYKDPYLQYYLMYVIYVLLLWIYLIFLGVLWGSVKIISK